ncbi:cytochrome P450 [Streptomyces scabiei]|uniref:cytochrome P450 n=1 Tax=Streptomyces scabiei TaxID=1930 RepID=UPI0029BF0DFD|nr:cytochrome P450 [Streptomyces scabiei]MDX2539892.1 cytochrome P450 [Streptomyces scabiei]
MDVTKSIDEHVKHFDIRDTAFDDPELVYKVYEAMRTIGAIVPTDQLDFSGRFKETLQVIGYAECHQLLKDWRRVSNDPRKAFDNLSEIERRSDLPVDDSATPISTDPPVQKELRKVLSPSFTPERMVALEPKVRAVANRLIDEFIEEGKGDLADFSWKLPSEILFAEFLGFPAELLGEALAAQGASLLASDAAERDQSAARVFELIVDVLKERVGQPPRDDIIDGLLNSEIGGRPLTVGERMANATLLVAASLETTSNALSAAYYWLAHHPAERSRLVADPSLLPAAVEEFVRYSGSVHGLPRYITADVEICGYGFKRGDAVIVNYAAANRDENEFADAGKCIIDREPNRHLGFGFGTHRCLGAPLARLELRVGFSEVLRRLPDYRIANEDTCEFSGSSFTRGYQALPVAFTPGRREHS